MRAVVVVVLLLGFVGVAGCRGEDAAPGSAGPEWHPFDTQAPRSLAYRVTVREDAAKVREAVLYIDLVPDGEPRLSAEGNIPLVTRPDAPIEQLFPVPRGPLSQLVPRIEHWQIEGRGHASTVASPDMAVTDVFLLLERNDQRVRYAFERVGRSPGASATLRGTATLARDTHRLERLEATMHVDLELPPQMAEDGAHLEQTAHMIFVYDAPLAEARSAGLARAAAAPRTSTHALERWVAENPPEQVLARALERYGEAHFSPLDLAAVAFYRIARPRLTWTKVLELHPAAANTMAFVAYLGGAPPDDALVELVEQRVALGSQPARAIATRLLDERLRDELSSIDSEAARKALAMLDLLRADPVAQLEAAAATDAAAFFELAQALDARPEHHVALFDAAVGLLASPEPHARRVETYSVSLLEGLTAHALGDGVLGWWTLRATLGPDPQAWLREAIDEGAPLLRVHAASRLALYDEPDARSRALLLRIVADDAEDAMLRLHAARTLARWRDLAGAPLLVELLASGQPDLRHEAFLALAWLAEHDLGYDPATDPVAQPEALGRWRAWLEVRRPTP